MNRLTLALCCCCCYYFTLAAGCAATPPKSHTAEAPMTDHRAAVSATLDAFHQAAARADADRYFAFFAKDAVFIGTDATERWTIEQFHRYADPIMARGQGWLYLPSNRNLAFNARADTAWFDEMLTNESYGLCRGTGVLSLHDGRWLIDQYHLTIPVPNDLAKDFAQKIREHSAKGAALPGGNAPR